MPHHGDRIRDIREKRRMTQDELATKAGMSKSFLSEVENKGKNIGSQLLLRIANVLGASVEYLLQGETTKAAESKPIVIPPELSAAAEQLKLSYAQTLELLEAHNSIVARRSRRSVKDFTVEEWKELYKAIKRVFGQ